MCSRCGRANTAGMLYCTNCGARLGPSATSRAGGRVRLVPAILAIGVAGAITVGVMLTALRPSGLGTAGGPSAGSAVGFATSGGSLGPGGADGSTGRPAASTPPVDGGGPTQPGVVSTSGIAAWDALDGSERAAVQSFQTYFLHQSVGSDLEDGAEAVGFAFAYAESGSTDLAPGLNGGLFASRNGDPAGKLAEFQAMAAVNDGSVTLAIMKFGYADVVADTVEDVQAAYQAAVAEVKALGLRVLHVTPPLVYDLPGDNAPKVEMRAWMIASFPDDVIFDLQDAESTDPATGARCERGGSWEICATIRSTSACPSLGQGVDSPSGQGHLCFSEAQRIAKAFLYAIYLAGR